MWRILWKISICLTGPVIIGDSLLALLIAVTTTLMTVGELRGKAYLMVLDSPNGWSSGQRGSTLGKTGEIISSIDTCNARNGGHDIGGGGHHGGGGGMGGGWVAWVDIVRPC